MTTTKLATLLAVRAEAAAVIHDMRVMLPTSDPSARDHCSLVMTPHSCFCSPARIDRYVQSGDKKGRESGNGRCSVEKSNGGGRGRDREMKREEVEPVSVACCPEGTSLSFCPQGLTGTPSPESRRSSLPYQTIILSLLHY
ncbi:hypothetical protein EYF80_014203 [Liparis tanakae]|uniref:Uncharacterized protein n=1 Tax=Liparis tanakae TaxID=230148 RepID=A0A4Z2IC93_9TELE|nr:hypothetical protein EYF80_014203 [Liparis tanakae]